MYVARNKNGSLYLYERCPRRGESYFYAGSGSWDKPLSRDTFPEVTWENSPVQVELKVVE